MFVLRVVKKTCARAKQVTLFSPALQSSTEKQVSTLLFFFQVILCAVASQNNFLMCFCTFWSFQRVLWRKPFYAHPCVQFRNLFLFNSLAIRLRVGDTYCEIFKSKLPRIYTKKILSNVEQAFSNLNTEWGEKNNQKNQLISDYNFFRFFSINWHNVSFVCSFHFYIFICSFFMIFDDGCSIWFYNLCALLCFVYIFALFFCLFERESNNIKSLSSHSFNDAKRQSDYHEKK